MGNCRRELSKKTQRMKHAEFSFTELFPSANMIRCVTSKYQSIDITE